MILAAGREGVDPPVEFAELLAAANAWGWVTPGGCYDSEAAANLGGVTRRTHNRDHPLIIILRVMH